VPTPFVATPEQLARLLSVVPADALRLVEGHLGEIERTCPEGPVRQSALTTLKSLWSLLKGTELVRTQADFVEASRLFVMAVNGFSETKLYQLRDLSVGLGVYVAAVVQMQRKNIGQANDLLVQVREYLRKAGQFASGFESLIDHIQPDAYVVAGASALADLDFDTARTLFDRAAQSAEYVATTYYSDGAPLMFTWQGLSKTYRALYAFSLNLTYLHQLDCDMIRDEESLAAEAKAASELLSKGDTENVIFRNLVHAAHALELMLRATSRLAKVQSLILKSSLKSVRPELVEVKRLIHDAGDCFSLAGTQWVAYLRISNQLTRFVDNLDRLARPSRRDFGVYSGLVSGAVFVILLAVCGLVNLLFKLGLSGDVIFSSCLALAVIGGFGYGAIRFKDLLFGKK
jgi:hypothetical protein